MYSCDCLCVAAVRRGDDTLGLLVSQPEIPEIPEVLETPIAEAYAGAYALAPEGRRQKNQLIGIACTMMVFECMDLH